MCKPFFGAAVLLLMCSALAHAADDDGKLHIICFGAHPDDCELQASGVGAMWAARGHHVKFVSVTNGDIGHWREAGGPLATRRKAEVEKAAKILGTTVEVLDNHDGELMPTLENRRTLIPPDPRVEGRRRPQPPPQRLPPRSSQHGVARRRCRVHGHCPLHLSRLPAAQAQPCLHVLFRPLPEALSV